MRLNELQEMWKADAKIEAIDLGNESLNVPNLHAKYLNYLSSFRLQLRRAESEYLRLRRNKYRFYKGEMTKDELDDLNWTQYLGPKLLKTELNEFIETDEDVIVQMDKIEYLKTMVWHLESILKSINSRSFDIKNAITYMQFTRGEI